MPPLPTPQAGPKRWALPAPLRLPRTGDGGLRSSLPPCPGHSEIEPGRSLRPSEAGSCTGPTGKRSARPSASLPWEGEQSPPASAPEASLIVRRTPGSPLPAAEPGSGGQRRQRTHHTGRAPRSGHRPPQLRHTGAAAAPCFSSTRRPRGSPTAVACRPSSAATAAAAAILCVGCLPSPPPSLHRLTAAAARPPLPARGAGPGEKAESRPRAPGGAGVVLSGGGAVTCRGAGACQGRCVLPAALSCLSGGFLLFHLIFSSPVIMAGAARLRG